MRIPWTRALKILTLIAACLAVGLTASPAPAGAAQPFVAAYVLGQPDFTSNGYNLGGSTSDSGLGNAQFTAYDSARNRLYVSDSSNSRVLVFLLNAAGQPLHANADYVIGQSSFTSYSGGTTSSTFFAPQGLAYDSTTGYLYVVDPGNVRVLVFATNALATGMSASYVIGQADFTHQVSGTGQNTFLGVQNVALDEARHVLFVVDTSANRVLTFDTTALANGMPASHVIGQVDFTSASGALTRSGLTYPFGAAYQPATHFLFVADSDNNRVLAFDVSTYSDHPLASFVLGEPDFTTSAAVTTRTGLNSPTGLALDNDNGRLFVADQSSNRILAFDTAALANGMPAAAVYGWNDFTSHTFVSTTANRLRTPVGLAFDPKNKQLAIVDQGNHRVLLSNFQSEDNFVAISVGIAPVLNFTVTGRSAACNGVTLSSTATASGTALSVPGVTTVSNGIAAQDLAVSTNAASGFTVFLRSSGALNDGNGHTIADVSGSNAAPGAFVGAGSPGFGYTTSDTALGTGTANRFTSGGAKWAAASSTNSEVSYASTGPVSGDTVCVAYQLGIGNTTPAGTYSTVVTYTVVPLF